MILKLKLFELEDKYFSIFEVMFNGIFSSALLLIIKVVFLDSISSQLPENL